jgi:hypothetical protein
MRIAIDMNDVAACTAKDEQVEFLVVLTGPSGKAVYEAWQQKQRDQGDHPQLVL